MVVTAAERKGKNCFYIENEENSGHFAIKTDKIPGVERAENVKSDAHERKGGDWLFFAEIALQLLSKQQRKKPKTSFNSSPLPTSTRVNIVIT